VPPPRGAPTPDVWQQKQLLSQAQPAFAGKITGMLLEMVTGELLNLLESLIMEAVSVLETHAAGLYRTGTGTGGFASSRGRVCMKVGFAGGGLF
jgi:hypothetical protein